MKKFTALLLAAMLLMLTACGTTTPDNPDDGGETTTQYLSVMWDASLGFDHVSFADGDNYAVSRLVFDSLFALDVNYNPQPVLAESIKYDSTSCIIKLKEGIAFHGGNTLTAADVAYTINMHLNSSESPYKEKLACVSAAFAQNTYTVVLNLTSPDGLLASKLDFPIIRNGAPVNSADGTGRYIYKRDGKTPYLQKNKRYYDAENTLVERINLVTMESRNVISGFNSGALTVIALRENRFNTDIEQLYSIGTYLSNKLTYLVPSSKSEPLKSAEVRKLLSYSINRTAILANFSATKAFITYSAINPNWYLYDASVLSTPTVKAEALLEGLGHVKDENGNYLTLNILVNGAVYEEYIIAKGMVDNFAKIGVNTIITSAVGAEYETAVSRQSFDLRFDSKKIPYDMDISAVINKNEDTFAPYIEVLREAENEADRALAASALLKKLDAETPIIPLYFTTTEYIAKDDSRGNLAPTPSSPLDGIWRMAKTS